MHADDRIRLEQELTARCAAADHEGAVTALLRGYGPEVLGFLLALHHDQQLAHEAFSQLCEDLWSGIGGFAGRSSFRTWLYTLARHALSRSRRKQKRRERHEVPLSISSVVQEQVRSGTLPYLQTVVKDRMAQLRQTLPQEDQALLILRVDRQLEWSELAQVLADQQAAQQDLSGDALKREAARLRKRFQLVKERLRELAEKEGLLGPAE